MDWNGFKLYCPLVADKNRNKVKCNMYTGFGAFGLACLSDVFQEETGFVATFRGEFVTRVQRSVLVGLQDRQLLRSAEGAHAGLGRERWDNSHDLK